MRVTPRREPGIEDNRARSGNAGMVDSNCESYERWVRAMWLVDF
jgi:hypothetical protein